MKLCMMIQFYFDQTLLIGIKIDDTIVVNPGKEFLFELNEYEVYCIALDQIEAEKAEYFNSKNLLIVTKNVKIKDIRGTMLAEKLIFDIKKNTLDISSNDNTKVDANINYK